jgi:histidyl-tRNA synthetase
MTPTFARMVAARANALRKPVRWFSVPQLFRYERQQKGRLREHFQLNVDIVGEPDVTADAELLAVAIEIMRALGLSQADVRARVSDRRLLSGLLRAIGVTEPQVPGVFAIIDKIERQPVPVTMEKLAALGLSTGVVEELLALTGRVSLGALIEQFGMEGDLGARFLDMSRYFDFLAALGVSEWVDLDLKVVRGLAYYTGIVFELFDAHGEFRAICGGGRYDGLLRALGNVDLPALGFGMGDVVLGELLRTKGLLPTHQPRPDYWVAYADALSLHTAMQVAAQLRSDGSSVEYSLRGSPLAHQLKAASAVDAAQVVIIRADGTCTLKSMASGEERNVRLSDGRLDLSQMNPPT